MKHIVLLVAVLAASGALSAQKIKDSEVPGPVKATFTKNFPNAKDVKWSKESASEFEAEFKNGMMEQAANFDIAGKWLITETEIKKAELPTQVIASLKKEFSAYKIEEAEKAETPDKGTFYEVKLEKGEKTFIVQLSSDGKILKKEEGKEEDK